MDRIIINYKTSTNKEKRLVVEKNLPLAKEIVYAVLCLQKAGVIRLDNVLSVKEFLCA